jgi:transposase-like protein
MVASRVLSGNAFQPEARAVDHEVAVLESFVTKRRDKKAAFWVLRKAMKKHGPAGTTSSVALRPIMHQD